MGCCASKEKPEEDGGKSRDRGGPGGDIKEKSSNGSKSVPPSEKASEKATSDVAADEPPAAVAAPPPDAAEQENLKKEAAAKKLEAEVSQLADEETKGRSAVDSEEGEGFGALRSDEQSDHAIVEQLVVTGAEDAARRDHDLEERDTWGSLLKLAEVEASVIEVLQVAEPEGRLAIAKEQAIGFRSLFEDHQDELDELVYASLGGAAGDRRATGLLLEAMFPADQLYAETSPSRAGSALSSARRSRAPSLFGASGLRSRRQSEYFSKSLTAAGSRRGSVMSRRGSAVSFGRRSSVGSATFLSSDEEDELLDAEDDDAADAIFEAANLDPEEFSPAARRRGSSRRSSIGRHTPTKFHDVDSDVSEASPSIPRHNLLGGDNVLSLQLDEVTYRDNWIRTERDMREDLVSACAAASYEWQRGLYVGHFGRSWNALVMLALERQESLYRVDHENEAFREGLALWEAFDRFMAFKREWLGEKKRMEERKRQKEEKMGDAAHKELVQQAKRKANERAHWRREKDRLANKAAAEEATNSDGALIVAGSAAAVSTGGVRLPKLAPDQKLRQELAAVREAAPKLEPHWRALDAIKAGAAALDVEESRHRTAIETEFQRRWDALLDEAVEAIPELVAHDHAAEIVMRRQAELRQKELEHQQLLERCRAIEQGKVKDQRVITSLEAHALTLQMEEDKARRKVSRTEQTELAKVLKLVEESYEVVLTHEARRAAVQAKIDEERAFEKKKEDSAILLNQVVENAMWRQRLGRVHAVKEEAIMLCRDEERRYKAFTRKETIVRGDLQQFIWLELSNKFPTGFKLPLQYLPSPDCVPTVEEIVREGHIEAFYASFEEEIAKPFDLGAAAVDAMPTHMVGRRLKSAKAIQHAFRGYRNRKHFEEHVKDGLVLSRMRRLKWKHEMRALRDTEAKERIYIEDEWGELDLFGGLKDQFIAEQQLLWAACIKIQSYVRGWRWRKRWLPMVQEKHYKDVLDRLKEKDSSRKASLSPERGNS